MSISVDTINLRFNVKPNYDQQQLNELQADLKTTEKEFKKTAKEVEQSSKEYAKLNEQLRNMKANRDRLTAQKSRTPEDEKQLERLNKRIAEHNNKVQEQDKKHGELLKTYRSQTLSMQNAQQKLNDYTGKIGLNKLSLNDLISKQKELNIVIRQLKPGTEDFERYTNELKNVSAQIEKTKIEIYGTRDSLKKTEESWKSYLDGVSKGLVTWNAVLQIKDRIVNLADQYVQSFAKMDDAMTDVMKYTGQTKAEVEDMNEEFKQFTTRTPREELNALAGAAGRLGIQGKENIVGFVDAADKINVALGDDLGEGAIDQIGKLTMVFGEDKTKGLNGAMLATGSAINVLGANSSANTGFITEFTSDMAGMAVNAKIAQTDIMGYASALSQSGVEGKTASGVFAQLITKMFTDPAKFAKAAKLDVKGFTDLLKTDANAAILKFLEELKQNGGFENLAPALKSLKMQGTQAVPVISSLINKMDELKKAQNDAKQAYDEGTSIIDEFNNANSSAAAKLEMKKKAINDAAVALGKQLMPIVEASISTGTASLKVISSLISFTKNHVKELLVLASTIVILSGLWAQHIAIEKIKAAWDATLIAKNKALAASMWLLRSAGVALQATWALLTKGVQGYVVVMRAAKLASLTNPWAALATVLTVVGVAIYGVTKAWKAHAQALREQDPAYRAMKAHANDMQDINKRMNSETTKEIATIHQLTNIIRSNAFSINERRAAIKRLQEIVPDYHADIDEEGRLIESNTNKLDDYIANLQKAARAQAYMDKLAEIENAKLDNDLLLKQKKTNLKLVDAELNRGKDTKYKSQKAIVTIGANGYTSGTTIEYETNDKLTSKLAERKKQQDAVNAALKTQEELTRREQALMNQMSKDGIVQNFVAGGSGSSSGSSASGGGSSASGGGSGDSGGSGGSGDSDRQKAEKQAKLAFEREKIMLKQQYQGKKDLQDEWHLKEVVAERNYLNELAGIRDKFNASESEKLEVANQTLDNIAKEANIREEKRKRDSTEELKKIDNQQFADEISLSRQHLRGEIATQEEYDQKKLEQEIDYQNKRIAVLKKYGQDYIQEQKRLEQLTTEQLKQEIQERKDFTQSYQNTNNSILHNHFSEETSFDEMRKLNQQYYDQELISYEQYQHNMTEIAEEEGDERNRMREALKNAANQLMQSSHQVFQLMQNREIAAVEKRYKAQIKAAKKAGKDTTKLEEQMEAEKAEIQKKYAQKQFKLQILEIIAATAQSIANVWKVFPHNPAVAAALSAVAAAQGAVQLATAKAQADQAAGLYTGGYSDEYQEGYTRKGDPRKQAGVIPVHQNEFVANHKAVANSQIRPVLDVIDRHQKIGDIHMLDSTRMLEEAYGTGRYRGGYTSGEELPSDMDSPRTMSDHEVLEVLRRIEDNTADSLTVRELRTIIRRQERLEANASR